MNAKPTHRMPATPWRLAVGGMLLVAGTVIDYRMLAGPSVIANPIPPEPVQTLDQQTTTNEMDVFQPAAMAAQNARPSLPEMFQYGPVQLHPHVDYRFLYGNGIQAIPGEQQSTIIQELSPGILANLGKHWAVDYTPIIRFYSNDKFKDGVDHSILLTGGYDLGDWKFGLTHSTQITSDPLAETGAQTDQSTHTTSLTASHAFSSKISADFGLSQAIDLVSGLQDSYDWSTMDWINYQFQPRLGAGIGVGGGYVMVNADNNQIGGNQNLDQTYEQVQARINWRLGEKVSIQVSGGVQDRQFNSANASDSLAPVFGAGIQYQPYKNTQIALTAGRSVSTSDYYQAAQETESTSVALNVSQRLFRDFTLGAGVGYGTTDYNTPSGLAAGGVNRTDDQVTFNVRLSHPFFRRGTWSVFYQYGENTSSQPGFGYNSSQTGFEISYRF